MLHLKYAVSDRANIRAAYTKTFIRPNFTDLTPGMSTDNTKTPVVVTQGNPELKPTFSNNFDLMGEYYFKGIGLLSGGLFYKDISNVIFSDKYVDGNGSIVTKPKNFDKASLYGFEAGINKRLDFLPGFWSGFGVEFNYTQIKSETELSRLVLNADKTYSTITDKISLPNQSNNLFNAILFYERNGVTVRFAGNYRGASIETVNQQLGPDFYVWTDKNFTIDASAAVAISKTIRVFAELNNLTDEPLKTYMGDKRRTVMTEWYGRRGQVGIRWDIIK